VATQAHLSAEEDAPTIPIAFQGIQSSDLQKKLGSTSFVESSFDHYFPVAGVWYNSYGQASPPHCAQAASTEAPKQKNNLRKQRRRRKQKR
jgi:hypothetical protein